MARPEILNPLFRSLRSFKGVGPQVESAFGRLLNAAEGAELIALDLLMHMPFDYVDRSKIFDLDEAPLDATVTLKLHVDKHHAAPHTKRPIPHRVDCHDESGEITLVFFGNKGGWLERALPKGEVRVVSGRLAHYQGQRQMTHPDFVVTEQAYAKMPPYEPVYPLTAGLGRRAVTNVVDQILDRVPAFQEWAPDKRITALGWKTFEQSMREAHHPQTLSAADLTGAARNRLAYDEYLAGQITLQIVRSQAVTQRGVSRTFSGELTEKVKQALPFDLTDGQASAVAEIFQDLAAPDRMSRLLQGDVGAGKTVVALMAMAGIAESQGQSALMAPTELLATQHFKTIAPLAEQIGLKCALLTGKMKVAERRTVAADLATGDADIVIGTHALFQADVAFKNLALVVVDEQHRFGVHQRLALSEKGGSSDLLVMTATPIPRTLVLTHFGDMAVTQLMGKPAGRQSIDTASMPIEGLEKVLTRLEQRIAENAQAYWVCPLVEESETLDLVSAQDRHAVLQKRFGDRVGLVHGRMTAKEKQDVMSKFIAGELAILVATTVIEVGVDVPNATIMIIENAERFGLSQLHQLRGRVGRGADKSACLLLYAQPIGETAKARLETIKKTEDGFVIAERDLELRGHGDVLGTRQSGMPGYNLALPDIHGDLLELAHEDAAEIFDRNPTLAGAEGEAVRQLLYLFRRDLALPLIRSG